MRRIWLDLAVLCLFGTSVEAWGIQKRSASSGSRGVISLPHSQYFEGADGNWTTFVFQIGVYNKQLVRLLPATSMVETYVVTTDGCAKSLNWTGQVPCDRKRGGLLDIKTSSSWRGNTNYSMDEMAIMQKYGYANMSGTFGWDTITPGYVGAPGIPVEHSVIAGVVDLRVFVLGQFGLRPEPTNFTDNTGMNAGQLSFIQKLRANDNITSSSYGFTAGAFYRNTPGTFGSLTLGGYDRNRRLGDGVTFPMYDDIETPLMVSLDGVWVTSDVPHPLVQRESLAMRIDSGTPFIYLPIEMCKQIAQILSLEFDMDSGYYYISEDNYRTLEDRNTSMEFHINKLPSKEGAHPALNVVLSYKAFVQTLSYPLADPERRYVPLRQATSPQQYVLGRTFLQEAYLTANYDKHEFSLHQAAFPYPPTEALVPLNVTLSPISKKPQLSQGLIGGVAAGTGALILLLLVALFFLRRARQRKRRQAEEAEEEAARIKGMELEISSPTSPNSPMDVAMKVVEIDSETVHEIGGMPREYMQEMGVPMTPIHGELPDESTLSSYGGFFKEVASEQQGGHPIIKVYYEMDGTPPGSEQNTPTGTLTSAGTTLIGSPAWSASGGSQSSTPGSTLSPLRNHTRADSNGLSPIPQTPAEFYDRRPAEFFNRMNDQRAGPSSTSNIGDMSPIPQTPLEYYGTAALPGGSGNRGWIGRAPPEMPVTKAPLKSKKSEEKARKVEEAVGDVEVPRVVLIPATPSEITEKERERRRWLRGDSRREGEGSGNASGKGKMKEGG